MRPVVLLASTAVLGLGACSDATGGVIGGQPLFDAGSQPLSETSTEGGSCSSTWTSLYDSYFGPMGIASCTAQMGCHSSNTDTGAGTSGFVCGMTKDSCYQGMTQGYMCVDAVPPCPIVPSGGSQSPTTTGLYKNLHKADGSGGNMPLYGATTSIPGYKFSPADMACIAQWIKDGAQNN